jgi:hypothetical protein
MEEKNLRKNAEENIHTSERVEWNRNNKKTP